MGMRVTKTKAPARKPRWEVGKLLTSPRSPLAQADIRAILSHPLAWGALDRADREEVLSLFPDRQHIIEADAESDEARPNIASLMIDDSVRDDIATYGENLSAGRHDDGWLVDALAAHERRKAGEFKDYLRTKFLHEWGTEP